MAENMNAGGMPTRRLGRIDRPVPIVGFAGIVAMKLETSEAVRAVDEAYELGIDYIDVAPSYGDAQPKIGEALKTRRDDFFLACKTLKRTRADAKEELDTSLRQLHAPWIDLYQFHAVDTLDDLHTILGRGGAMELFLEARDAGLIRHIGITGHRPDIQAAALKEFAFDTCMTPVNFVDRFITGAELGLLPLAASRNVGVIAIKATMRSAIEDKRSAFRYTLSQNIAMTIPAGNLEEIRAAAGIAKSFEPMDSAEMHVFLRDNRVLGTEYCRQCGYCMPCTVGLDIPTLFRTEGYYRRYNKDIAARQYETLAAKPEACSGCRKCEARCPFGIPIETRMREIASLFAAARDAG